PVCRAMDCFASLAMTAVAITVSGLPLVAEIRFDRAVHLDGQRVAVTVLGISSGDAHPAFADAIFLDIGLLDALEANADVAREDFGIVVRAVRIDRQTVGKLIVDRFVALVHSSASIPFRSASGVMVGACAQTPRPNGRPGIW